MKEQEEYPMKMLTRILAAMLALVMLALPALAETTPEDVLATVNGVPVTRAAYELELRMLQDEYGAYGYDVTDEMIDGVLRQMAMLTCVEYALLTEKVVSENLQLTDEEKADAAQEAREYWQMNVDDALAYYGVTEETPEEERAAVLLQVLAGFEADGYTEESFINEAITFAGYEKVYQWAVKDVAVPEEEVRAYYDELVAADQVAYANDVNAYETMQDNNQMYLMFGMTDYYVDLYYMPEGYRRVTHILLTADDAVQDAYNALASDAAADPAALEAARAAVVADVQPTLDEINALLEAGESFASLIPLYTQDPGMSNEAAIAAGYLVHPQSTKWVTEYRDAAFTVNQPGEITAPVVTANGVHILQYVADVPGGPAPYTDDVRALLHEQLLSGQQAEAYGKAVTAWMDSAEIVYAEEMQELMSGL